MSGSSRRRLLAVILLGLALLSFAVPSTNGAFVATVNNTANTVAAASRFTCSQTFDGSSLRANAYLMYDLTGSAATQTDSSGSGNAGTYNGTGPHPTGTASATTACPSDTPALFYAPNGTNNWVSTTTSTGTGPSTLSIVIWFRTTTSGFLMGLNSQRTTAAGGSRDRHVYVGADGKVRFGVYNTDFAGTAATSYLTLTSPATYTDNTWHMVVATVSNATGMALWMDGQKVDSNPSWVTKDTAPVYWRIGMGSTTNWPSTANDYFSGGLRFAAAYKVVLSDSEIATQYANGKPGP